MAIFRIRIEVGGFNATRFEDFDALVGTPSFLTAIPTSALQRLGIERDKRELFVLPDGSEAEYDVGRAIVRLQGLEAFTQVVSSRRTSNRGSAGWRSRSYSWKPTSKTSDW